MLIKPIQRKISTLHSSNVGRITRREMHSKFDLCISWQYFAIKKLNKDDLRLVWTDSSHINYFASTVWLMEKNLYINALKLIMKIYFYLIKSLFKNMSNIRAFIGYLLLIDEVISYEKTLKCFFPTRKVSPELIWKSSYCLHGNQPPDVFLRHATESRQIIWHAGNRLLKDKVLQCWLLTLQRSAHMKWLCYT